MYRVRAHGLRCRYSSRGSAVGRLLHLLDTNGLMKQTVVMITADHGERPLEHGIFFDHHSSLCEPIVRVPLLRRFSNLLGFLSLTLILMARTRKLGGNSSLRPVLTEYHLERKRAVRIGQYKLIQAMDDGLMNCRFCSCSHGDREELFDLEAGS